MEQQDRETILYHERRFDSATFHKNEREEEIIDRLRHRHRYSKGIT